MNQEQKIMIEYDAVLKILDIAKDQKQNIGEMLNNDKLNKYDIEFIMIGYEIAITNIESVIKKLKENNITHIYGGEKNE